MALVERDGVFVALKADDGWFSRKCRKINHSQGRLSFLVPSFLDFSLTEHGKYKYTGAVVFILLQ